MTIRTLQSKLESLLFSGKDEDFEYFAERFEARLKLLNMRTVFFDQENLPQETDANFASEQNKLKEEQFEVWCELVQCPDRQSLSLVKTAKPYDIGFGNFRKTERFKSRERPRIHQLLNKLTNLRKNSKECMRE